MHILTTRSCSLAAGSLPPLLYHFTLCRRKWRKQRLLLARKVGVFLKRFGKNCIVSLKELVSCDQYFSLGEFTLSAQEIDSRQRSL